jgi:hypothetical protein
MLMRFDPFREFDRMAQGPTGLWQAVRQDLPLDADRDSNRFSVRFDVPASTPKQSI